MPLAFTQDFLVPSCVNLPDLVWLIGSSLCHMNRMMAKVQENREFGCSFNQTGKTGEICQKILTV